MGEDKSSVETHRHIHHHHHHHHTKESRGKSQLESDAQRYRLGVCCAELSQMREQCSSNIESAFSSSITVEVIKGSTEAEVVLLCENEDVIDLFSQTKVSR
jgi:hypothetical protein